MSKNVQVAELSIYNEEDEVLVENLSFNLDRGEMARLAGLTERQYEALFHVLSGEASPNSGQIVLANRNVVRLSGKNRKKMLRNEVSFVPRDFELPRGKSVLQSLKFKLAVIGPPREPDERLEEVLELTELVGKEEVLLQDAGALVRVKARLGLAIVNEPELLVCLRPFSTLNSSEMDSVVGVLSAVNARKGVTVLLLTDDLGPYDEINVIKSDLDSRVVERGQ